ncbi:MAG: hypothetical protein RKE49_09270 [Oceanicaulis sp.]
MTRLILAACAAPILFACSEPEGPQRDPAPDRVWPQNAENAVAAGRTNPDSDNADQNASRTEQGGRAVERSSEPEPDADGAARTSPADGGAPDGRNGQAGDVPPPQNALPDDAGTVERAYLLGPWTAKGGDCARPAFDVSPTPGADRLTIETSLDGAPRTGEVRFGENAAFVFDQPDTVFSVEQRAPESLAVMPPEAGAANLGGYTIEGDGRVFIACPD